MYSILHGIMIFRSNDWYKHILVIVITQTITCRESASFTGMSMWICEGMNYVQYTNEVHTLYIIVSLGCSGPVFLRQFNPILTIPLSQWVTCSEVAFWYSGLTLHAGSANTCTVNYLSYDWQCMTVYEVAHNNCTGCGLAALFMTDCETMTHPKKTIRCWTKCSFCTEQ